MGHVIVFPGPPLKPDESNIFAEVSISADSEKNNQLSIQRAWNSRLGWTQRQSWLHSLQKFERTVPSDFATKPPAIFITRMEPRVKGQSAFWLRLNNLPKAGLPTQDVWPFGACGWVSANYENRRNELQNNYQCRWFLKWHRQWARRHQKQRCFRTSYFLLLHLKSRRRNT